MNWPIRVWEMGGVSPEGKQLWYGRPPTKEDIQRRRDYERDYLLRRART